MIFKGYKFRRTHHYIALPVDQNDKDRNYVKFGKVIPHYKPLPSNAVKTNHKWIGTGSETDERNLCVYATPIDLDGHSRTNMAYYDFNKILLLYDGHTYIANLGMTRSEAMEKREEQIASRLVVMVQSGRFADINAPEVTDYIREKWHYKLTQTRLDRIKKEASKVVK